MNKKNHYLTIFLATIFISLFSLKANAVQKPKLVVLIVIDQFRYDYITRFEDQFTGGFKMFRENGAFYTNANYDYAVTHTSVGHSCIVTGTTPDRTGIVMNNWFDHTLNRTVYSCEDTTSPTWVKLNLAKAEHRELAPKELIAGRSPAKLMAMTIGDALKLSNNKQSKVFSISHKDRAAILMGGKLSNGTYWVDQNTGEFTSSAFYAKEAPEWLNKFNKENSISTYFGKNWTTLLPDSAYSYSRPDNDPYENSPENMGNTFPHPIRGVNNKQDSSFVISFLNTPYANNYLVKFAETIIDEQKLGQGNVPDLLCISFSANDIAGHAFGPNSREMQDFTIQTDKYLGDFFQYLENKVGLQNTLIFLSADHGVTSIPNIMQDNHYDAGRLSPEIVINKAKSRLKEVFLKDSYIAGFAEPALYLNHDEIKTAGLSQSSVEFVIAKAIEEIPQVEKAYIQEQLWNGHYRDNDIDSRFARNVYPDRSGDIFIHMKPFWYFGNPNAKGTEHGTPYPYDTHVPILALGYHVPKKKIARLVGPEDIAPTIANILGVELSTNNRRDLLYEVIQ